ncbi:MAG: DUF3090 family protein [Ktedonobacteraceae bacterium]|nr:DUF3090 family protein [Ktedonobacteraceae bacterium]
MSTDLGLVTLLGADAVGQPGQRRFRLFMRSLSGTAIIWMEKEQLTGLSEALDRSLALITEGQVLRTEARAGGQPFAVQMPTDFPRHPTYEFQVGQIRLNFDESDNYFSLSAAPLDVIAESGQEPQVVMREDEAVSFSFTQQQAQNLSNTIQYVVAGGRPVCPLCHTPLDGGPHACVKQNGHQDILQLGGEGGEDA